MTEPQRLEKSPRAFASVHAAGLQAMVDVEDESLRQARHVVSAVTSRYSGKQDESRARRNAAAAAALLFQGVSGALTLARGRAALAADAFVGAELDVVLKSLAEKAGPRLTLVPEALSDEEKFRRGIAEARSALEASGRKTVYRGIVQADAAPKRAAEAAKGYVQAWREKLDAAIESRAMRGSSVGHAFEDAAAAVDYRVATSVATEVSQAFNARHLQQVDNVLTFTKVGTRHGLYLRWDATLDRRTCDVCSSMHGRTVNASTGWGGSSPGAVHPRCRCVETLVHIPNLAENDNAAPKRSVAPARPSIAKATPKPRPAPARPVAKPEPVKIPAKVEAAAPTYRAAPVAGTAPARSLSLEHLPHVDLGLSENLDVPKTLPTGESHEAYRDRTRLAVKAMSERQRNAIDSFTGNSYSDVRRAEHAVATGQKVHASSKALSDDITAGLAKAIPEPGTVYRGMNGVPKELAEAMVRETGAFRLGIGNVGGTASATWHPGVAVERFMLGSKDAESGYKVLFQIHHRTGVGIEAITQGEAEVMFGRDAKFRVLSSAKWAGRERVLIIELEEM